MTVERKNIINLIGDAQVSGAGQSKACEVVGISAKTIQRWSQPDNVQDGRLDANHQTS
jgi:hypothetical protein